MQVDEDKKASASFSEYYRYVVHYQETDRESVRPCDPASVTFAPFEYLVCSGNMVNRLCLRIGASPAKDVEII